MIKIVTFCALSFAAMMTAGACSQQELEKVQTASSVRDQLCAELDTVAALATEIDLSKARAACAKGDDLKAIAAAYAGCYEPPTPAATPAQAQPEAPAVAPATPADEASK